MAAVRSLPLWLCLVVLPLVPAQAQVVSLQGQWEITVPSLPDYAGTVLVDAAGRATWDSPRDYGRPAKFRGYVSHVDGPTAKISFTDGASVAHAYCAIQSSDLLLCRLSRDGKWIASDFTLTRRGPGPKNLTSVLP